ncbi:hypothetical protein FB567DRAFT_406254, partial [Paraphoma chrysanthemicola]
GKEGFETTSNAGTNRKWFHGELARWDTFAQDVLAFYRDKRMVEELSRCKDLPIGPDSAIRQLNKYAATEEVIMNGGETTLSGRFFQNALVPVISSVHTMASKEYGSISNPPWLPSSLTFGDSWIIDKRDRAGGLQPDIVLKLRTDDEHKVRMVGELKFCVTVDLEDMAKYAINGDGSQFDAILGQIIQYMLTYRVKYGFLSNYTSTVMILLENFTDAAGNAAPCIYFSDVIKNTDCVDEEETKIS